MSNFGKGKVPAVSIAIPFHNPGIYLEAAVRSVFAQTFTDWELLLMDDGSSDGSREFAAQLNDPRVFVYSDGEARGLASRLNQSAHLARGEYLFRMDADDMMCPQRVELQYAILQAATSQSVVGGLAYSMDSNSKVVGWRPAPMKQQSGFEARYSFLHPTVAAPTLWFRENPYSTEAVFRRSEDAELWCRTTSHADFLWLNEPLLFYREMGVFKLQNYLIGVRGLVEIIRRTEPTYNRNRWKLEAKEYTKMLIARTLSALGAGDVMVRHRFKAISPNELKTANAALEKILRTPLPLKEN